MKTNTKKNKIKAHVKDMLKQSNKAMLEKIDKAINSGAIDIDSWEEDNKPMVLPKTIVTALLESESTQYRGIGTSHEKRIKKDVKNLRYFI
jgi:hypothetical protein